MDTEKLRKELKEALEEYVGFPPDEVPRWVDWGLALDEALTVIDKYCWLKDDCLLGGKTELQTVKPVLPLVIEK